MKCDKVMDLFLEQDSRRALSFRVRLHTLFCPECRKDISLLQKGMSSVYNDAPYVMSDDISDAVMHEIRAAGTAYKRNVSTLKWVFTGVLILSSIFLISFSNSFNWLKGHFGGSLEIPLNIVLGLAISIYSALFIGTHLDELKEHVHFPDKKAH